MHVKRLKRGPQLGDLVIMNGQTQKKYRVSGFGEWRKMGRFGTMELERFVMLQFQGQFYADGRVVKLARNPYREIGLDWFWEGRHYGRNSGYSVVIQTTAREGWLTMQENKKARDIVRTLYEQGKITEKQYASRIDALRPKR